MSNSRCCSTDERESKMVNVNKSKSKGITVNAWYTDKSESKIVHKLYTRNVKDAKDEEPLVTDNSKIEVIKAPGYFKLFKCGKKFFNNMYTTYKCACMENDKGGYWGGMYETITK